MAKKKKDEIVDTTVQQEKTIIGIDCGTMNLVKAIKNQDEEVEISSIRNMYLPLDKSQLTMAELSNIDYVESDGNIYIVGEDAYRFGNMFGQQVKRPMSKGLISANEVDGIDVLSSIIKQLIGTTYNGHVVYSIPSGSVDSDNNVLYHQNVFKRIFTQLGYTCEPFNEALAIIYSQCRESNYSGIAFSFGAGMLNCNISYRSVPIASFSVARSGDWIDEQVAMSVGSIPNRVTKIKEKGTNLSDYQIGNKKERRTREAIIYYYREVIRYGLDLVKKKLDETTGNIDLPDSMPLIVSGGTSLATGFLDLVKEAIEEYDEFPIDISEIRMAGDPLSSVAEGLLIKGLMTQQKGNEND